MTYLEFIQNILKSRGRRGCGDNYHEKHHIVPKCMGGTNDEDNLIDLYAREHFIAHKLLAKENPDNDKLVYAWWCMSVVRNKNTQERYELTPEEHEEAKIAYNNVNKGHSVSKETRNKISEALKKLPPPSEQTRKKLSIAHTGENNAMYGKTHTQEAREKISKTHKGKTLSDEHISKIIEAQSIPVAQYSLDGSLIQIWKSAREAARSLDCSANSITQCCKKRLQTANRFIWRYVDKNLIDDVIDASFLSDCYKVINQYTKNGQFVKTWGRQIDIVNKLGISSSHLNACLKGKRKSTGGFVWKYKE